MDDIVNQIVGMSHGVVSVVVNSFQFSSMPGNDPARWIPARCGSRIVEASEESIIGLTQGNVHFCACTVCGAVSVGIGIVGDDMVHMSLEPNDPRSRLLLNIITETENGGQWGEPMNEPARVGSTCFNC